MPIRCAGAWPGGILGRQHSAAEGHAMASEARQVGIFLFDGVDLLCTSGPACLLASASRQLTRQGELATRSDITAPPVASS